MVYFSNQTLMKIASIGGIITCSAGMLYHSSVKHNIRTSDYYVDAFKTLRSHRGATKLLGEPIREGRLDLGNRNNYFDKYKAHIEVPVKGSYQSGMMYFWATRSESVGAWVVQRIELGVQDEPDRRLLLKDVEVAE